MTTTAHRRSRPAPGPDVPSPAGGRAPEHGPAARAADLVQDLVDSAAREAREAGHQLRVLHRLWVLARTEQRARGAAGTRAAEREAVLDVADEIGPALRLSAGAAVARVREAVVLGGHLPEVLDGLEAGRFGPRHAAVLAEQWRELVEDAPEAERAPAEIVRRLVAELAERAPDSTPAQLRACARRRRAALLAETVAVRHRRAREQRRVWVEPDEDGMAWLHALLDAPTALAAADRLDALVERLSPPGPSGRAGVPRAVVPAGPPDPAVGRRATVPGRPGSRTVPGSRAVVTGPCGPGRGRADGTGGRPTQEDTELPARTPAQLRADVLADLLLAGEVPDDPSFPRDVRGQVTVTVPVLTLLEAARGPGGSPTAHAPGGRPGVGTSGRIPPARAPGSPPAAGGPGDLPAVLRGPVAAVLAGHGPIDADVAARLAAGAPSWHRILVHPVTGVVLDHDRTTYAVPADLRRRLVHRDVTCRFPGCRRRAERCDLDHTVAWQDGGPTAAGNLAHLCRHHHLVKHRDGPLGRWTVRQLGPSPGGGVLEWTSPAGRIHRTVPEGTGSPVEAGDPCALSSVPPPAPEGMYSAVTCAPGTVARPGSRGRATGGRDRSPTHPTPAAGAVGWAPAASAAEDPPPF
ncbi:DUF222 domain-containing protein [Kocuria sp. LUK]|uniref:HNH endonuclease signature motif containing protein n=1 Tax=Kocuria sp. LUK TaxID=2897828 RepID=UPI001E37FB75|nr:HNH endonuclease signature motif containing protein [Kocuria sp. LUK]MCD1146119.1 DUF222 domain-containing protein [Kocuria sp. LUK]